MKLVGFQGVPGAYSEIAAKNFLKGKYEFKPCRDFRSVFSGVESGRLKYGVIPIENSLAGSIHENYDHLQKRNVWICGEYKLRVSHCLVGLKSTSIQELKHVYSHPQALAQCASYLRGHKDIQPIPYFDTAGSAKYIAEKGDPSLAAVASRLAAKQYGLKVLEGGIEDNEENYTRFLLIEKKQQSQVSRSKIRNKTSIVFALKNIPGCLHKCLSVFAIRDIDLFKIESRPIPGSPWKYVFYLDFRGGSEDEAQSKALSHLSEITDYLKVLGSFKEASVS